MSTLRRWDVLSTYGKAKGDGDGTSGRYLNRPFWWTKGWWRPTSLADVAAFGGANGPSLWSESSCTISSLDIYPTIARSFCEHDEIFMRRTGISSCTLAMNLDCE